MGFAQPIAKKFSESSPMFVDGGMVVSWLVRLTPDRAVRIRALARYIVFCPWAGTLNSHSSSRYQGVQMGTCEFDTGGGG